MNSASASLPALLTPPLHDRRGAEPAAQQPAPAVPSCSYRLWVTETDGELTPQSCHLIAMVVSLDLARQVRISHEPPDANLAFLRACVDAGIGAPQPYLEQALGGCSAAVVHYLGQAAVEQLRALDSRDARPAALAN